MKRIELLLTTVFTMFVMIGFVYGQDTTLTVTSGGTVGIGTTTPSARLELFGSTGSLNSLVTQRIPGKWTQFGAGVSGSAIKFDNTGFLTIQSGSNKGDSFNETDLIRITAAGRLGIGTTNPASRLHVHANGATKIDLSTSSTTEPIFQRFFHSTNLQGGAMGFDTDDNVLKLVHGGNFDTSTEGLAISSDGYVGIGTTSPDERLTLPYNQYIGWEYSSGNSTVGHKIGKSSNGAGPLEFVTSFNPGPTGRIFSFIQDNGGPFEHLSILYNGNVGIGTTSPTAKLHIGGTAGVDGIKFPDGTLQTTAATGGSGLWSAAGSDIFYNTGNVGIGTTTTQFGAKLEVADRVNVIGTGTSRVFIAKDGNEYLDISYNANNARGQITTFDSSQPLLLQQLGGNVGIGTTTPGHPLDMASGAHVTAGGVWTDASSRQYKENIANLTQEEAISALEKLNPVRFNYKVEKDEEYLGFIAEDVPDLVAVGDRKSLSPMDIVAVLTKVVQQQQQKIAELEARLNASQ